MRADRLIGVVSAALISLATAGQSRASIVITSVNQVTSASTGGSLPESGGQVNNALPLEDQVVVVGEDTDVTSATQKVTNYTGPTALNQAADSLALRMTATAVPGPTIGSSAHVSMTLNFTLDFAESYTYSRSALTPSDIKLLFVGKIGQSEIDPGSGNLGSGDYILKLDSTLATPDILDLEINNPTGAPEPASISIVAFGGVVMSRRRRA